MTKPLTWLGACLRAVFNAGKKGQMPWAQLLLGGPKLLSIEPCIKDRLPAIHNNPYTEERKALLATQIAMEKSCKMFAKEKLTLAEHTKVSFDILSLTDLWTCGSAGVGLCNTEVRGVLFKEKGCLEEEGVLWGWVCCEGVLY